LSKATALGQIPVSRLHIAVDIRERLAENLRRLRALNGWSQEDYAERPGIHRTYVSDLERGARNQPSRSSKSSPNHLRSRQANCWVEAGPTQILICSSFAGSLLWEQIGLSERNFRACRMGSPSLISVLQTPYRCITLVEHYSDNAIRQGIRN
jgi:DNA-binding XRE family transcriptional regulator